MNNELLPFEGKKIRKIWYDEQLYFSVIDIVGILSDSPIPRNYWSDLKRREPQLHEVCVQLKMLAPDGRNRLTDCASTKGIFRIIMAIPSPKAEPLKLWLAEQGEQAIEEAENPELLAERQRELYRAKGYSEEWIKNRLQTIETRKQLTDEWQKRGVKEGQEYSILTATIAKGTFGLTPSEHAELKNLKKQNLRDHMTPFELIFTALSEEATRALSVEQNAQGFMDNQDMAQKGGTAAGNARRNFEKETGLKVVSPENFLNLLEHGHNNPVLTEKPKGLFDENEEGNPSVI